MNRNPRIVAPIFVLIAITVLAVESRFHHFGYFAAAVEFDNDGANQTRIAVTFKQSQKPVNGAIVEVYDGKKLKYRGRTDEDGVHIVPSDALDAETTYFFTVRRAGYEREYDKSVPGKTIPFELTIKYGPPIPED